MRETRQWTQAQLSKLSGIPRPTLAHLESGDGNPTLSVLAKLSEAMNVPIEELISPPRSIGRLYRASDLVSRRRGNVAVRKLLPDTVEGIELDRLELDPGALMHGVPHRPGTREYLCCEQGQITLILGGERWTLGAGDVFVFRGDQKHTYQNTLASKAVGYSIVFFGGPA